MYSIFTQLYLHHVCILWPHGVRRTLKTCSFSCPFNDWHHRPLIRWPVSVSLPIAQHLRCDLIRQFDSHVCELVDNLIEESVSLEPAPLPANFSPSMSDKERSKLRYCLRPRQMFCSLIHQICCPFIYLSWLCFLGVSGRPMARASNLWTADPCWSK